MLKCKLCKAIVEQDSSTSLCYDCATDSLTHLNRESIEALGWEVIEENAYYIKFFKDDVRITWYVEQNMIKIYTDKQLMYKEIITMMSELKAVLRKLNLLSNMTKSEKILQCAKMAHQTNKAWCELNGDYSQVDWDKAEEWQKESAIKGVEYVLATPFATNDKLHNEWMQHKLNEGWKFGVVKDVEKKEHPCLVPWEDLEEKDKVKDILFRKIVNAVYYHE